VHSTAVAEGRRRIFCFSFFFLQEGAGRIALALQKEDVGWYPSASLQFINEFRNLARILEPNLELYTPFISLSKAQVILKGKVLLTRTNTHIHTHTHTLTHTNN
jgi:7-cyano-7-deazaguanine synthase in queuosine biosynthesis